jgi:hypothetical protein
MRTSGDNKDGAFFPEPVRSTNAAGNDQRPNADSGDDGAASNTSCEM